MSDAPQVSAATGAVALVGPPGAGKSTRVPLALLDDLVDRYIDEAGAAP